jgi:hypothetical protein
VDEEAVVVWVVSQVCVLVWRHAVAWTLCSREGVISPLSGDQDRIERGEKRLVLWRLEEVV